MKPEEFAALLWINCYCSILITPHKLPALHTENNQPSSPPQISIFVVLQFSWSCHPALTPLLPPCSHPVAIPWLLLWVFTGCAMGWLQVQQQFCWPVERKDLSSVQEGELLVMCEDLSPIKTCLRHPHHMGLVCRGHHDSSEPLRTELLIPVICCPKALKASVVLSPGIILYRMLL